MTAPFAPAVATLVTGPHRQTVSATANDTTGPMPLELRPGSSLEWSERRAPCVSASLVCAIPDTTTLARLDPRRRVRVTIRAGYYLADGTLNDAQIADLHLRAREVDRPAGTMTLTFASDEFLVIDAAPRAQALTAPFVPTTVSTGIASLILAVLAGTPFAGPPITDTAPPVSGSTTIGNDYWRAIEELADIGDLDVYDEGDRVFRIAPRPYAASTSTAVLATGPTGTRLTTASSVDRDDWANDVALYYEWRDSGGATQSITGTARAVSPFAPADVGLRTHTEQRTGPITQAAADAAAAALLRRMLSRAQSIDVTAVAMWWLRPRRTVTVQLPTGGQQRRIIAAVNFDLDARTMRVLTRAPETDTVLTGE